MRRLHFLVAFCLVFCELTGCRSQEAPIIPVLPPLGAARVLEPGVKEYEVALPRGETKSRLWIYLPSHPKSAKVPCLFIAPSGGHMFDGKRLTEGSRAGQLPYVHAGFAVVAYDVDGALPEPFNDSQAVVAAAAFQRAGAGVANAQAAINYALARVPQIDPSRLYTAGHSSAGSLALLMAEQDPRIAACIAYAPCCDAPAHIGPKALAFLSAALPGFDRFSAESSPDAHPEKMRCPLFLFHADDDPVIPTRDVADFALQVEKHNAHVKFVRAPTGGHSVAMMTVGIPRAIQWLRALPAGRH